MPLLFTKPSGRADLTFTGPKRPLLFPGPPPLPGHWAPRSGRQNCSPFCPLAPGSRISGEQHFLSLTRAAPAQEAAGDFPVPTFEHHRPALGADAQDGGRGFPPGGQPLGTPAQPPEQAPPPVPKITGQFHVLHYSKNPAIFHNSGRRHRNRLFAAFSSFSFPGFHPHQGRFYRYPDAFSL